MQISPVNNINIKGIPVANIKVKGFDASYALYNINYKDKHFLDNLYKSLNLKKLMPHMAESYCTIWNEIINNAIKLSKSISKKSILETHNNIPCGILSYTDIENKYYLNYIATFPTEIGKRVPAAGQILFFEIFNRFIKSDKTNIELSALRQAPFNPISTYLELGFDMKGGNDYNELMRINKNRAAETLLEQKKYINYIQIQNPEYIDLNKHLKLNFMT